MNQFIATIIASLSRRVPPFLKDRLLEIPMVRYLRDLAYKGSRLQPLRVPGLPWSLYLYINLKHPGERLFVTRDHEPHVVQWALNAVKPGWIVLDIGAFIGFYAVLFGKLVGPEGRVIAFEPIESLKNRILSSSIINNLTNVVVETVAIGCECREVEFWVHEDGTGGLGTSSSIRGEAGKRPTMVKMITIDQYVHIGALPRVDLIKIDVEGAELDVLLGAQETLKKFRPVVLVEFNSTEDRVRSEKLLRDVGYMCKELGRSSYGVHIVAIRQE